MKRYFLTSLVPRGQEIESGVSIAMCNFSRNLMSGEIFNRTFSILAVYVRKCYKSDADAEYVCSLTRPWGGLFRIVSPVLEQIKLFFKIECGSSLWLYNMTTLSETLFLLLRWFKPSVKIYTIVLDFTPGAKNNDRLLKRINASDGLIVLADCPLFTHPNKLCLPGVVFTDANVDYPKVEALVAKRFLLSGALNEQISQISKVLRVFAALPECELHITGIEDKSNYSEYSECPNIHLHDKLAWDDYLDLMHSCPFILSTRDIHAPENQCNFPSKIIESLLHNRIIVSTFAYEQLKDIKILKVGNEVEDILHDIQSIVSMPDFELLQYANQSARTKELFSVDVWKEAIENIENNE